RRGPRTPFWAPGRSDSRERRQRAVRRYGECSDAPGAALEYVEEVVTSAQVEIEWRRPGAGAAADATRVQQLQGTTCSDTVAGNGAASSVRRVHEAAIRGRDHPARCRLTVR